MIVDAAVPVAENIPEGFHGFPPHSRGEVGSIIFFHISTGSRSHHGICLQER